jgi:hypothetical protein
MDSRPLKAFLQQLGISAASLRQVSFDPKSGKVTGIVMSEPKPSPPEKANADDDNKPGKAPIQRAAKLSLVDSLSEPDRHWPELPPEESANG